MPDLVDLHSHSYGSPDGTGLPRDLARHFRDSGFRAFSLTDHNSFAGQAEAAAASEELGIAYVPGIEIGSHIDDPELAVGGGQDMLCYYFTVTPEVRSLAKPDGYFLRTVAGVLESLREENGPALSMREYERFLRERYPEHAHLPGIQREALCDLMIEQGAIDPAEASRNGMSLSEWRRQTLHNRVKRHNRRVAAAEPRDYPTVSQVSRVMRETGAVVIMAHPGQGNREPCDAERLRINRWLDRYVDGVEVYHHRNSPAYREMLLEICRDRDRPYTGGGDRHNCTEAEGHVSEATTDSLRMIEAVRRARQGA